MPPSTSPAALRVAVVGPTHPYKGGVAAHTTTLAHELAEAGHDVTLVSWSHLYPSLLYPGEQAVPGGAPDVEPFPRTVRALSWARPDTWVRAGRRLADVDAIVVVHVIPQVVPAHLALLRAAGVGRREDGARGPRTVVIAHNVLPHEPRPGDERLMAALMQRVDAVVVHSDEQARLARDLGARRVRELDLPPHLPGGPRRPHVDGEGRTRVLALGIVRDYKGVDLLLTAARDVEGVEVTVAGELWGEAGRRVRELAADPRLRGRVEVHGGYVPADRIAELLARHDALALTYRSATASQNALLAQAHGVPVLASAVGTFPEQVTDDEDGLVVPAGDVDALRAALTRLADPATVQRLRRGVHAPDLTGPWAHYVGALEALASRDAGAIAPDEADTDPTSSSRGGLSRPGGRAGGSRSGLPGVLARARDGLAHARRRVRPAPRVTLRASDLPEWVRPSDVLLLDADATLARRAARELGLPRSGDAVAAWAALGALAAVVRLRGDGRRPSVIVDESGSASPLARWLRAVGLAPVEIELTGRRASVEALDLETASLDVITRVHPGGCTASDVDQCVSQASWALRSGGLLVLTLPLGEDDPQFAVGPADVRALLARADDLGLVLVGDLDGELAARMRRTEPRSAQPRSAHPSPAQPASTHPAATQPGPAPAGAGAAGGAPTAYGIVRLTLRRR